MDAKTNIALAVSNSNALDLFKAISEETIALEKHLELFTVMNNNIALEESILDKGIVDSFTARLSVFTYEAFASTLSVEDRITISEESYETNPKGVLVVTLEAKKEILTSSAIRNKVYFKNLWAGASKHILETANKFSDYGKVFSELEKELDKSKDGKANFSTTNIKDIFSKFGSIKAVMGEVNADNIITILKKYKEVTFPSSLTGKNIGTDKVLDGSKVFDILKNYSLVDNVKQIKDLNPNFKGFAETDKGTNIIVTRLINKKIAFVYSKAKDSNVKNVEGGEKYEALAKLDTSSCLKFEDEQLTAEDINFTRSDLKKLLAAAKETTSAIQPVFKKLSEIGTTIYSYMDSLVVDLEKKYKDNEEVKDLNVYIETENARAFAMLMLRVNTTFVDDYKKLTENIAWLVDLYIKKYNEEKEA